MIYIFSLNGNTIPIQEPRVEAKKWGKLLWGEGPHWFWGLLGKWFRFAYNEHSGEDPKQFKFKSFCHQHYTIVRVSKGQPSFCFSQILGAASPWTIVESSILLWLHTLVLTWCTWCVEWVAIPFFIKSHAWQHSVLLIGCEFVCSQPCIWRVAKASALCCLTRRWRESAEN